MRLGPPRDLLAACQDFLLLELEGLDAVPGVRGALSASLDLFQEGNHGSTEEKKASTHGGSWASRQ